MIEENAINTLVMQCHITLLIIFLNIHGFQCLSLLNKKFFFIINGEPTHRGDLPFMVSLQRLNGHHVCGGSIITERAILTAAHCLMYNPHKVVAGVTDLTDYEEMQERYIFIKRIHPLFRRGALYDIAIVKVTYPFYFSSNVNLVGLANLQFQDSYWIEGRVAGWGITDVKNKRSYSSILLKAQLKILSPQSCYEELGDDANQGLICARPMHINEDACQGDSGGPLLHYDYLIGIISAGLGCGNGDFPGIYTNVSYFTDWIIENSR